MTQRLVERLVQLSDCVPSERKIYGRVRRVAGRSIYVSGCNLRIGERCRVRSQNGGVLAETLGFDADTTVLAPYGDVRGIASGAIVESLPDEALPAPEALMGRTVDALGKPLDGSAIAIDGAGSPAPLRRRINPLDRRPITEPLDVGVRCINSLFTVGLGQRVGLFAGSGVGKSVLLGMMARMTRADVVVVGLIGERGREVREFIEDSLAEGRAHSVVVASPADDPAILRLRAAFFATQIAERFRYEGNNVLLIMDSLTRVAQAQRELGLAAGEPPTSKGYTPSVYSLLPTLVERAGNFEGESGSVTGFYTVLTEEDDLLDPVADAARAVLDGHIVLSRRLSDRGLYPAVDVTASLSRVMPNIVDGEQLAQARDFRELWTKYSEHEDLINVGAYTAGADPELDRAIAMRQKLEAFITQRSDEVSDIARSRSMLANLFSSPMTQVADDGQDAQHA